jgi:hypothetical protein
VVHAVVRGAVTGDAAGSVCLALVADRTSTVDVRLIAVLLFVAAGGLLRTAVVLAREACIADVTLLFIAKVKYQLGQGVAATDETDERPQHREADRRDSHLT